MSPEAHVEQVAREAYGRLLALVASRARDISASEDALADAFLSALESWPAQGIPSNPAGWLVTVAKRRITDTTRKAIVRDKASELLVVLADERAARLDASVDLPDERLALLFVCAHPAIEPGIRSALMLQTVLGLDAARIASAMCVAPKTLGQRLWRAKTKIRDAGLAFEVPPRETLEERLDAVLEAIYAAYGSGWSDVTGEDGRASGLRDEAIWLARVLASLLPTEPEAHGLSALLLFAEARRGARPDGVYVPLAEQDAATWDAAKLEEAERELRVASGLGRIGPFQLEAAIQSAHVAQRRHGLANDGTIAQLYAGLVHIAPTLGARVAHAAAVARAAGSERALPLLEAIDAEERDAYQPYWAVLGHVLLALGPARREEARSALERAAGLAEDPAVRAFLLAKAAAGGTLPPCSSP